ncbi:MAG: DnaJ domain-containing protein [Patescibacteria group bacterium]
MKSKFDRLDRRNPFARQMDVESEEHNPTSAEISEDLENVERMKRHLYDIDAELRDPGLFDYGAEYDERRVMNPQDLWDEIAYAWIDHGDKIKDPEEKARIKQMADSLDQKILRHFIPFLESSVRMYGQNQSYSAEFPDKGGHFGDRSEDRMEEDFESAYMHIRSYKLKPEDRAELLAEVDQIKQKADEYRREPWLYKFEKQEKDLWRDIESLSWHYYRPLDQSISFGAEPEHDYGLQRLEKMKAEAEKMQQIVGNMSDSEIKDRSENRSAIIQNILERQELSYTAPKELLSLQARLDDIISDLNAGAGEAVNVRLDAVKSKLDSLEKLKSASQAVRNLYQQIQEKYRRAVRLKDGESFANQEMLENPITDPDWALNILGLDAGADPASIKQAYKKLVRKYHPDLFANQPDKDRQEAIMKKINEAFMFLKNLGKTEPADG